MLLFFFGKQKKNITWYPGLNGWNRELKVCFKVKSKGYIVVVKLVNICLDSGTSELGPRDLDEIVDIFVPF